MKRTSFKQDLDDLWAEHDVDGDNVLNKTESKKFIEHLVEIIDKERAQNYNADNFDATFAKFDEDSNNLLSKGEMATLIKKLFSHPDDMSPSPKKN